MNCQHIARIVDQGGFATITGTERAQAESHARDCPHCAPVWAVHSRLADLPLPSVPAELTLRSRTAWAMAAQSQARPLRRLGAAGAVVAMVAAAAMVWVATGSPRNANTLVEEAGPDASALPVQAEAQATSPSPEASPLESSASFAPVEPAASGSVELPLIPRPSSPDATSRFDLALAKLVERHPEMVDGPPLDGHYVAGILLRSDGSVIDSVLRHATDDQVQQVESDVASRLPTDGGGSTLHRRLKSSPLPDGRLLRAGIILRAVTVSDRFDLSRSTVRVRESLGNRYDTHLLPATGAERNQLTVLFDEDGKIVREHLQHMSRQEGRTLLGSDPADVRFLAESIATQLQIDPEQIGLMGVTHLEQGLLQYVMDASGTPRADDRRRMLLVRYAWPRREGEAQSMGQPGPPRAPGQSVDTTKALIVVEQLLPDAFAPPDPAQGTPAIVFTEAGKVIQAGRLRTAGGASIGALLKEQLVPGVETAAYHTVRVTNAAGVTATLMFAWEAPRPASPR